MNIIQLLLIEILIRNSDKFTFKLGKVMLKILKLERKVVGISKKNVRRTKDLGCITLLLTIILFIVIIYLITILIK